MHRWLRVLAAGAGLAAAAHAAYAGAAWCRYERRDHGWRAAILRRVSVEYQDMPGLRLTLAQAQRLFGIREDICLSVLTTLVQQEILRVDANGAFVRNGGRP